MCCKFFLSNGKKGKSSSSFYRASITQIPKLDEGDIKKQNQRTASPMNINAKIPDKILANRIQYHIMKTIRHDLVRFIPGI